jgi:hypothetical protein
MSKLLHKRWYPVILPPIYDWFQRLVNRDSSISIEPSHNSILPPQNVSLVLSQLVGSIVLYSLRNGCQNYYTNVGIRSF